MPSRDLKERTRLFALSVFHFCRTLPKTDEAQEAARQLRRAANSVRSNYRSARNGRSRDEFAAKLGAMHEEADECRDWLQYLHDTGIRSNASLLQEAHELTRIFSKALQTTRINSARMRPMDRGPRRPPKFKPENGDLQ